MTLKKMNRRHFMKNSTLGLVAAGTALPGLSATPAEKEKSSGMVYRTLGRTGLRIPLISFGVMNSDKPEMIKKALSMGIKHLDTAHVYLRGNSEKVIGQVLKETGARKKVYIGTKMRFSRDREKNIFLPTGTARQPGATKENFNRQLAKSLKRLQTDYLDILYLHSCYSAKMATHEGMLNALVKAKKSGKARFIGVTTHKNEPEVIRAAVDTGIIDVIQVAYFYLKSNRKEIGEALAYAAKKGVGIVGMKTFGGNRLQQDKSVQINHRAALKWVLNNPHICTVIPGMTTFDQMDLNVEVMDDVTLTPEEKRDLELTSLLTGTLYCQNCRACIPTCKKGVEIPNLIRAYMYAEGYGNLIQAESTILELPENQGLGVCRSCTSCTARCAHGIQIGSRIRSLIHLNLS
jgi:predicted aldo/keto reductase-like oxidoreductase